MKYKAQMADPTVFDMRHHDVNGLITETMKPWKPHTKDEPHVFAAMQRDKKKKAMREEVDALKQAVERGLNSIRDRMLKYRKWKSRAEEAERVFRDKTAKVRKDEKAEDRIIAGLQNS